MLFVVYVFDWHLDLHNNYSNGSSNKAEWNLVSYSVGKPPLFVVVVEVICSECGVDLPCDCELSWDDVIALVCSRHMKYAANHCHLLVNPFNCLFFICCVLLPCPRVAHGCDRDITASRLWCHVMYCWQETGLGSEITYDSYTMTSTASTTSTQLPPAIANLLASTAPQPAVTNLPNNTPVTSPNPTTAPVVAPSSSAPLLPQPQSTPPPPQCNIPPLPVFLGMPLPVQQQIFQSVPVHIQQQMLSSLPPPLQNQLGPLMGSTGPNNALPFPVSKADQ